MSVSLAGRERTLKDIEQSQSRGAQTDDEGNECQGSFMYRTRTWGGKEERLKDNKQSRGGQIRKEDEGDERERFFKYQTWGGYFR